MPSFSQNVSVDISDYVDVYVDIDVEEYLDECSSTEITEIVDYLIEKKVIPNQRPLVDVSAPEQLFEQALAKIHGKWNILTAEEEQAIYNIAKRF